MAGSPQTVDATPSRLTQQRFYLRAAARKIGLPPDAWQDALLCAFESDIVVAGQRETTPSPAEAAAAASFFFLKKKKKKNFSELFIFFINCNL